jgi:soluble epoxide hydrolase/lipid-phosphate phosphatase
MKYIQPAGYGVVAVDDFGYAGPSKPTNSASYARHPMARDLCEILDAENLNQVISLGRDWGTILAPRLYNFHPERVKGLVTMNVAYAPPTRKPFDLDQMTAMMTNRIDYGPYWYWYLFTSDDRPKILDAHVESFFTSLHGDPAIWVDIFCKKDGLKDYLLEDQKQEILPYATPEMRESFVKRMTKDGFTAPLLWYTAMMEGEDVNAEKKVVSETSVVKILMVFMAATKDPLGLPAAIQQPVQLGLLPDLTIDKIDAGH